MAFSDITIRENGQKILYSWFNALRTAGIALEAFLGSGYTAPTLFTCANNQGAAANVTGLLFSSSTVKMALIEVLTIRKTDTGGSERLEWREMLATYVNGAWELLDKSITDNGTPSGVTFSITVGGQIQYTSDSISGSNYMGAFRFRAQTLGGYV